MPDRTPLDPQHLTDCLAQRHVPWPAITVVASTGSTNADALQAVAAGAPEGWVLVADEQVSGRGRLTRTWHGVRGAGIAMSVVLHPRVPVPAWGWLPLLTGVATASALNAAAPVAVRLKWPNDLVVERGAPAGPGKLGGILVERAAGPGAAVVVGVGINVDQHADELPGPGATSLRLLSAGVSDRESVIAAVLAGLAARYSAWQDSQGDAAACGLREAYERISATIGRPVRLALPGGTAVDGVATGLDETGRLLVDDGSTARAYAAGEVVSTRPAAR